MDEYAGLIAFSVMLASIGVVGIAISGILWVLTQIAADGEKQLYMYKLVIKSPNGTWVEERNEDKAFLEDMAISLAKTKPYWMISVVVANGNDKIEVDI